MDSKNSSPRVETRPAFASGWLRRKSIEQVQAEYDRGELKKTLGPWNLLFLGIGCIIGAGIFVRTGNAAALHAGPAVMLSFLVAGLVCAFAGLCYAELASVLPVSGSAYTYSYATLGEFAAWMMGALLLLEYGLAASVVAVGWSGYAVSLLHDIGIIIPPELTGPLGHTVTAYGGETVATIFNLPALIVCLVMMSLLVVGVSESASVNNIIVIIKGSVIVAFILIGAYAILQTPDKYLPNWTPFIPEPTGERGEFGFGGVMRAASIVFFAYIGFEAVSTAGQEAKNPKRDMPFGILGSLIVCTILYIGVAAVLTLLVNYKDLNTPAPVADAVNQLGEQWKWFAVAIKIGAIAGLTSVILVLMYGQTRIFYTMAKDGLLPGVFGSVHSKFKTPWINTILVGVIVAIAAAVFDINTLGDLTSVGTLAAFAAVCFTVIYLRRARPDLDRGFKVPLFPIIPIFGILSCLYLITTVEMRVLTFFAYYLAIAVVIYFLYGTHNSAIGKASRVK
ncbi:MAG TPA: amino acid permease [Parvularcula sp.]|nr:amino acid permease [Parvularcula sp.]